MTKRIAPTEKLSSSNPAEQALPELPTPTTQSPADAPAPAQESGRKPFEDYLGGLPAWKVAALKASTNWPQGYEVAEDEFKAALEAATGEVIK